MSELFDHLKNELNDVEGYQDFLNSIWEYVSAIEDRYESPIVSFETRGQAHAISARQETNTILLDIALSLRKLSGRDK